MIERICKNCVFFKATDGSFGKCRLKNTLQWETETCQKYSGGEFFGVKDE